MVITAWLEALQPWHWLLLALLMLGAEALGTGGFLLGAAAAACLLALLLWLLPEWGWAGQFMVFGLATLLLSVAYWKLFRGYNERTEQPTLNDRAAQMIGRQWVLEVAVPSGESRLQIGDTRWRVQTAQTLAAGERVRVVASDGMILQLDRA
ncbi:hypothetical protein GCM10023333_29880 [Ferrimonas pelagia]|uniref:NfeD-like C-terminal domain-containing protein n=2 Tax=Ferrimonas pelagia TaxID=1177826 RepID=A0ABP9F656_9GAMM